MKRGSVTVFLALVLVLIMSLIFSLLEGARVFCLKGQAELLSEVCMQSVFANYHTGIWEDYHLLFWDGSNQEAGFSQEKLAGSLMEEVAANLMQEEQVWGKNVWDLTALSIKDVEIGQYQLATDRDGKAFLQQISTQMRLEAAESALEELLGIQAEGAGFQSRITQKERDWQQAWDAIEQAENMEQESKEASSGTIRGDIETSLGIIQEDKEVSRSIMQARDVISENEVQENPMEYVKQLKNASILTLVLENPTELSTKIVENHESIENRQLQAGNWYNTKEPAGLERLWLQYYISRYFSSYTKESTKGAKDKALAYEVEYLLGGKKQDSENLEKVVWELIAIREVMNFATLMQDAQKKALALSIATATVGVTGVLPLIKAVQIGVLLAWSFVESILDIRTLLAGGKVPMLKRVDQWSSDLSNCQKSLEQASGSKEHTDGLGYGEYLQMLLFLQSEKTITYRCMDILECNEQVRMDTMVQAAEATVVYEAEPLFWSFNLLKQKEWEQFEFYGKASMNYGG